ncbi:hypothetical protein N0V82_007128 [Gnomoniopsis sp. IMI 355080]|nr:hypothetical protein N0V82_007128 [Gnomoniopsis sp. IMI 355080]
MQDKDMGTTTSLPQSETNVSPSPVTVPASTPNGDARVNTSTNGTANTKDTGSKLITSGLNVVTHSANNPTPTQPKLPKASTNIEWGPPIGLHLRESKDEPLMVFRRAVGINSDLAPRSKTTGRAELGQREPVGMYKSVIEERRRRQWQHAAMSWCLNIVHFAQVVIGATLTALGPNARLYTVPITVLGALNTVIAGVLALLKGQGLPERLHKDGMVYQRLQEWVEETEALLVTGIIGRDNRDIGVLVESAFKKYNSAKLSEENNRPDNYVPDPGSTDTRKRSRISHSVEKDGEKLSAT